MPLTSSALTFSGGGQTRLAPLSTLGALPITMLFLGRIPSTMGGHLIPMSIAQDATTSARHIRIRDLAGSTNPGLIEMWDTSTGATVRGGQLVIPSTPTFMLVACSWGADGKLSQHMALLSGSSPGVSHASNFFTGTVPAAVTASTARLAMGGPVTSASTNFWLGEIACWGWTNTVISNADFDALVSSSFLVTRSNLKALNGIQRLYETKGSLTTAMTDLMGNAGETLSERVGTGVADYTSSDVPYDTGGSTVQRPAPLPPTQIGGSSHSIAVVWTPPSTVVTGDKYQIYVNNVQQAETADNTSTSYTLSLPSTADGTVVSVQVAYGKTGDFSALSESVPMTVGPITSIIRRPVATVTHNTNWTTSDGGSTALTQDDPVTELQDPTVVGDKQYAQVSAAGTTEEFALSTPGGVTYGSAKVWVHSSVVGSLGCKIYSKKGGTGTPLLIGDLNSSNASTAAWRSFTIPADHASDPNTTIQFVTY
jgi:hypothetical protein